ncbi:MAG: potassium-transporting ATPase subunit B, partial [Chryseosolibacter sp.]
MSKRIKRDIKLFERALVNESIRQSFAKLNPRLMMKNPVMFCVEIGTAIMLIVYIYSFTNTDQGSPFYNVVIFLVLLLTLLFANFAE